MFLDVNFIILFESFTLEELWCIWPTLNH